MEPEPLKPGRPADSPGPPAPPPTPSASPPVLPYADPPDPGLGRGRPGGCALLVALFILGVGLFLDYGLASVAWATVGGVEHGVHACGVLLVVPFAGVFTWAGWVLVRGWYADVAGRPLRSDAARLGRALRSLFGGGRHG